MTTKYLLEGVKMMEEVEIVDSNTEVSDGSGYVVFIPGFKNADGESEVQRGRLQGVGIGGYDSQAEAEREAALTVLNHDSFKEITIRFIKDIFVTSGGGLRHDVAYPVLIVKSPEKAGDDGQPPVTRWREGEIASVVSVALSPKLKEFDVGGELSGDHVVINVIHQRDVPQSLLDYWEFNKSVAHTDIIEPPIIGEEILKDVDVCTGILDYSLDVSLVINAFIRYQLNGLCACTTYPIALSVGGNKPVNVVEACDYAKQRELGEDYSERYLVTDAAGYESLVEYLLEGHLFMVETETIARAFATMWTPKEFTGSQFKALTEMIACVADEKSEHESDGLILTLLGENGLKLLAQTISDDDDIVASLIQSDDKTIYRVHMLGVTLNAVKSSD